LSANEQWAIGEFPALASDPGFKKTSDPSPAYNCIAFAAGDEQNWWWPFPVRAFGRKMHWPVWAPREVSVEAFVRAFEGLGYRRCRDGGLKRNVEKIAIYASANNAPTHAAIQMSDGLWKSKLGSGADVAHADVASLAEYGTVTVYMRRRTGGLLWRIEQLARTLRLARARP
jgi:hypothetical protein